MIVPRNVEEKIRYLLRKFPSTEWSGVLFYSHEGSFENNDLTLTCKDIFPMDLGTTGWTEFNMNEDVAAYMAENIELFNYDLGLIHSHHNMGAFFSGQDNKMLQQEGEDTNCFVSLVVDTRGKYVARITRKVQTKSEVTIKKLGTSYEFFGEGNKTIAPNTVETTKVIDKEVIEYFDLNVDIQTVDNPLSYLDTRFEEIKEKKKYIVSDTQYINMENQIKDSDNPIFPSFRDYIDDNPSFPNKEIMKNTNNGTNILTSNEVNEILNHQEKTDKIIDNWEPDTKKIYKAAVTMITCSFIINVEKFNLKAWITKYMEYNYNRIFSDDPNLNYTHNSFMEWRDFIIQFVLDYYPSEDTPLELLEDTDTYYSILASAIKEELMPYAKNNKYITAYCDALDDYII